MISSFQFATVHLVMEVCALGARHQQSRTVRDARTLPRDKLEIRKQPLIKGKKISHNRNAHQINKLTKHISLVGNQIVSISVI